MRKKIYIFDYTKIAVALFMLAAAMSNMLLSCNSGSNKEDETPAVEDSVQTIKSIVSEDSAAIYDNKAGEWITLSLPTYKNSWNRFSLKEFWYQDSMQLTPFTPEKDFYKDYANFLRWSPDSNYVLDIGTYGSVLVKDKNGNVTAKSGEADTEASLLFPKTNNKYRIFFVGPGTIVLDGKWIDSTQFSILTTVDEKPTHIPDTIMWLVDVKDKFFRKYQLK